MGKSRFRKALDNFYLQATGRFNPTITLNPEDVEMVGYTIPIYFDKSGDPYALIGQGGGAKRNIGSQHHNVAGNVLAGPDEGYMWMVYVWVYEDAAAGASISPLIDDDGTDFGLGPAVTVSAGETASLLPGAGGGAEQILPVRNVSGDIEQLEAGSGIAADSHRMLFTEEEHTLTKVIP